MTYSQSLTGNQLNDFPFLPNSTDIPDTGQSGNVVATLNANKAQGITPGMQQAMRLNDYQLCQNPDGSQSYYQLDAELSRPGYPVLRAVKP